jgi:general stress protein 26
MLTTRAADGHLHARAMTPAGRESHPTSNLDTPSHTVPTTFTAYSSNQVNLVFVANNASPKFKELQNDSHVNVNFFDTSTTHWASFSGIAKVIEDREVVKKYWSSWYASQLSTVQDSPSPTSILSSISSYFGDLGDGVHKGDEDDPRVALIEVVPDEIRYWLATSGSISRGVQEIASAVQGKVTIPGEMRTITKDEVSKIRVLSRVC